jgi:hypothetical protein
MLRFAAKFFFCYTATLLMWYFIHTHYETFLFFFTIEVSRIFGQAHFSNPEIIDGIYTYRLGNGIFRLYEVESITLNIFIAIPLLLASSGISLINRIKMFLLGFIFLFLFQTLFLLIVLYQEIYLNYPLYLKKGIRLDQILTYTPVKSWVLLQLRDFFNTIFKFAAALGIWIGLVSYYKGSDQQHWIKKLL